MRIFTPMLALLLLVHSAIAQEPTADLSVLPAPPVVAKPARAAASSRKTTVFRIKNAVATEVANAINQELLSIFGEKPKHNGFIVDSPAVIIPEVNTNSLLVSAKPPYMDRITDLIRKLDKAPTQIMIQILIQEVEDGKATILSRPQVMTLDGTESVIEIGSDNKTLRIKLTPRVVRQRDEGTNTSPPIKRR